MNRDRITGALQNDDSQVRTLRDEFAMAALMGPLADFNGTVEQHAADAYKYADAMLKARGEK